MSASQPQAGALVVLSSGDHLRSIAKLFPSHEWKRHLQCNVNCPLTHRRLLLLSCPCPCALSAGPWAPLRKPSRRRQLRSSSSSSCSESSSLQGLVCRSPQQRDHLPGRWQPTWLWQTSWASSQEVRPRLLHPLQALQPASYPSLEQASRQHPSQHHPLPALRPSSCLSWAQVSRRPHRLPHRL